MTRASQVIYTTPVGTLLRCKLLILLLFIGTFVASADADEDTLVVWDLKNRGISRLEMLDYIDRLAVDLAADGVAVLDRRERDRLFGSHSVQIDPRATVSEIIASAEAAGVSMVVYGELDALEGGVGLVLILTTTDGSSRRIVDVRYASMENAAMRTRWAADQVAGSLAEAFSPQQEPWSERLQIAIGFSRIFDSTALPAAKYLVSAVRTHYENKLFGFGIAGGMSYTPGFGERYFAGPAVNLWMPYLDFNGTGEETDAGANADFGLLILAGDTGVVPLFHFELCPLTMYIHRPDMTIEMLRGGMYLDMLSGEVAFSIGLFKLGWRLHQ